MYNCDVWLSADEGLRIGEQGLYFLRSYCGLARLFYDQNLPRFAIYPKHHALFHTFHGLWSMAQQHTSSCSTQSLRRHLRMKTLSAESAGRRAELAQDKSLRVRGNDILCSAMLCGAMDYTERPEKQTVFNCMGKLGSLRKHVTQEKP